MKKILTLIIPFIIYGCSNDSINYQDNIDYQDTTSYINELKIPEIEFCIFGGKNYILPDNAYCTSNDKYNAWLCNDGYYESGESCIYGTKPKISKTECNIKGNISFTTGEKIYHKPGCEYYNETKIDTRYGERWFCNELEAVNAGWRKAYNCY